MGICEDGVALLSGEEWGGVGGGNAGGSVNSAVRSEWD